jgi:outer membrane protein assembly factor BamB
MTFWQDARPATPRLRKRRRRRRRDRDRGRAGSRLTRNLVVAVLTVAVVAGIAVVRSGGAADADAAARSHRHERAPRPAAGRDRVLPVWRAPAADWPRTLLPDGPDMIAVADHHVRAYRIADGKRLWATSVPRPLERAAARGFTVLIATEDSFVSIDRATGSVRWSVKSPERPGPVALVGDLPGSQLAIGATDAGGLVGIDDRAGRARWSVRFPGHALGPLTVAPVAGAEAVIGVWSTADDQGAVLRAVDGATGALRWEQPIAPGAGAPAVAGDLVVVSSGDEQGSALRAFSLADGAERWRSRLEAPSQPDLVPLVDGAQIVTVDQRGTVVAVRTEDGRRRWATATDALTTYARPLRVRDAILLWNERGEVVTLDRATGALRARRRTPGGVIGLVGAGRRVVLGLRLIRGAPIQAFRASELVAPDRIRR